MQRGSANISKPPHTNKPGANENQRATGIEPAWPAWKAGTLPLSYARAEIKVARRAAKCQLILRKVSHNPACRSPISRMRSRPGWRCGRQNRTNYLTQRALSFRERCLACNRGRILLQDFPD